MRQSDDKTMWAVQNDLKVNFRNKLVLKFMGDDVYSSCETTCKTMLKACEDVMEERDTDLAKFLFKNRIKTAKGIEGSVCVRKRRRVARRRRRAFPRRESRCQSSRKRRRKISIRRG